MQKEVGLLLPLMVEAEVVVEAAVTKAVLAALAAVTITKVVVVVVLPPKHPQAGLQATVMLVVPVWQALAEAVAEQMLLEE
tara:strand:+ start:431 stop:673 length:243 start_codon:yes stop_codon:yes gene_type:complete